jgi:hypothetical protein
MPYSTQWVEPELLLDHQGVKVYRVYKNDELEQGAQEYHFTLDPEDEDAYESTETFDVRDLSTWKAASTWTKGDLARSREMAIKQAIETEELRLPVSS